jgi:hypothetical protein
VCIPSALAPIALRDGVNRMLTKPCGSGGWPGPHLFLSTSQSARGKELLAASFWLLAKPLCDLFLRFAFYSPILLTNILSVSERWECKSEFEEILICDRISEEAQRLHSEFRDSIAFARRVMSDFAIADPDLTTKDTKEHEGEIPSTFIE